MPLDPRIPAMAQRPKINTPFENLASILAERRATMQDQTAQAELRQKARLEQEQAVFQQTVRQLPDFSPESLDQVVRVAPTIGTLFRDKLINQQKDMAETADKEYTTRKKEGADGLALLSVVDGPETWAMLQPTIAKKLPDLAQVLGTEYNPKKIAAAMQYGVDQNKKLDHDRATFTSLAKGELGAFAQAYADEQDPEAKQHMRSAAGLFIPPAGLEMLDQNPQAFTMTPAQKATDARAKEAAAALASRTGVDDARQAGVAAEQVRHNRAMEARPVGGASGGPAATADAKEIAAAIVRGEQPPELTGLYGKGAAVRAELARQGYNQAAALTDWRATQKHVATLNSAQQTRMAQAIDNADHSLDVIADLAKKWDAGRFPLLNRGVLKTATAGGMGKDAQQIATALEAQIADVTSELANVYMGGNSPTDHALDLAAKNLSADWNRDQLLKMIQQSKGNLTIRRNSMSNVGVAGASPDNPYAGGAAPAAAAPGGATHKVGEIKVFPNGNRGRWDGQGWELIK